MAGREVTREDKSSFELLQHSELGVILLLYFNGLWLFFFLSYCICGIIQMRKEKKEKMVIVNLGEKKPLTQRQISRRQRHDANTHLFMWASLPAGPEPTQLSLKIKFSAAGEGIPNERSGKGRK